MLVRCRVLALLLYYCRIHTAARELRRNWQQRVPNNWSKAGGGGGRWVGGRHTARGGRTGALGGGAGGGPAAVNGKQRWGTTTLTWHTLVCAPMSGSMMRCQRGWGATAVDEVGMRSTHKATIAWWWGALHWRCVWAHTQLMTPLACIGPPWVFGPSVRLRLPGRRMTWTRGSALWPCLLGRRVPVRGLDERRE